MAPRFLVPSLVWYGLDPALPGPTLLAGTKPLSQWGGQLTDEDAVRAVLLTVDPAILLLVLAGYQVRTVVAGVPAAASETATTDLVNVDLATMLIQQGTLLEWTDPDTARADAQVALWVEPRFPSVGPEPSGVTLDLSALQAPLEGQGIDLLFSNDGTGWLRFSWAAGPGSWLDELPGGVDRFVSMARTELATLYAGAPPTASGPVVAGLLSVYDPTTWTVSGEDTLPPAVVGFGADVVEATLSNGEAGLTAFLTSELPIQADQQPDMFGGVRPPTAAERFADPDGQQALDACVDDIAERALAADPIAETLATGAYADATALSLTGLLLRWQERDALDILTLIAPAEDRYGGYDLQEGDVDLGAALDSGTATVAIYGGLPRTTEPTESIRPSAGASAPGPLPPPGSPGFVALLRRDLAELGFGPAFGYVAGEATAQQFGVDLELAVREFQIAATCPYVAWQGVQGQPVFYADTLGPTENRWQYTGPISGVVNDDTRKIIGTWLDRQLRCPVVIEARIKGPIDKNAGDKDPFTRPYPDPGSDNLWGALQLAPKGDVRMYARDFSGAFTLEPDNLDPNNNNKPRSLDKMVLGHYRAGGPWASAREFVWWHETEVSPEKLVGKSFWAPDSTQSERSTFRVVRSVADVECMGYFDVFSASDRGIFSTGPYHWTIGLHDGNDNVPGELVAYFAFLSSKAGTAADAQATSVHNAFYRYGCGVLQTWPQGKSGPQVGDYASVKNGGCWKDTLRKYQADMTLDTESGDPIVLSTGQGARAEWFRQWHWCYRFAMAARTDDGYRGGMWDFTRLRLADILSAPWPNLTTADTSGKQVPATVGDVFTSELAVALLVRWHVNSPGTVLLYDKSGLTPGSGAWRAFTQVHRPEWGDPQGWTDDQEKQLTDALYQLGQQPNSELSETMPLVHQWGTAAWEKFNKTRSYQLTAAAVSGAPVIKDSTGTKDLDNVPATTDKAVTIHFTVDFKDEITRRGQTSPQQALKVTSSDHAVAPDPDPPTSTAGKPWTFTVNHAGQAGPTRITIQADNGAHVATSQFTVRFGPAGHPADPKAVTTAPQGLSARRDSFQLDKVVFPP